MSPDEPLLDGRELWHVGLDVDVYILELADLLAREIHQQLAVPVGDVERHIDLIVVHRFRPPSAWLPTPLFPVFRRAEVFLVRAAVRRCEAGISALATAFVRRGICFSR